MNPKLDLFFQRRSVRKYEARPVPEEMVRDILEAGMAAPSATAHDPWRFVVLAEPETRQRVAEGLPHGKMLAGAGVGIVVCGDPATAYDGQLSYLIQDLAAAVENMLLAAVALGLGACWLGSHPRQERMRHIQEVLGLPEAVLPVAVIAIGWPAETKWARTRYDEAKVHRERW